jgi:DNA-directed RNA polymerase subunit K/omega
MASGVARIAAERLRQIEEEGWTVAHDDQHRAGTLVNAALSYAEVAAEQLDPHFPGENRPWETRTDWPWDAEWWKPSNSIVRNLVKAGALIAAEIDRLQREVD